MQLQICERKKNNALKCHFRFFTELATDCNDASDWIARLIKQLSIKLASGPNRSSLLSITQRAVVLSSILCFIFLFYGFSSTTNFEWIGLSPRGIHSSVSDYRSVIETELNSSLYSELKFRTLPKLKKCEIFQMLLHFMTLKFICDEE